MVGMNYRLLGYVFDQKRIRGAVWRLVWRGVQDALYELSDALKATVTGKVGTLRRVSWERLSGALGWIKMHQFKKKISRKSFVYAEYRDCKFVRYMRE